MATHRIPHCIRLDPLDRAALDAELARRALAGEVADLSSLVREALRATFAKNTNERKSRAYESHRS